MNRKVYKIWMLLLDKPGEWFYTEDIAFQMDLTRKQIYALLSKFPTPPVERERLSGESGLRVRINGSEAYLKRVRDSITMDWFKIDEEVLDRVRNALPQAGWVTLTDLAMETGITASQVAKALTLIDEAECRTQHGIPLYRLAEAEDVRVPV